MPKPRIMFYHDGRHPHIYRYEPPMQKEEYQACIDELVGTPIDVLELPHHGQWNQEPQAPVNNLRPPILIQSTNISRYKKDRWTIPRDTVRFVTAIDGDITTTISEEGVLTVTGSNHPANMAPCVFTNHVSPLSQQWHPKYILNPYTTH